jgi:hypothetical protein
MQVAQLIVTFSLILAVPIAYPQLASSQFGKPQTSDLPPAPDTGTTEDDSKPGGTRTDRETTCNATEKPLTSLLAMGDFTLSQYPTFWFYVPFTAEEVSHIAFVLKEIPEDKTTYQASIQLSDRPGIIKIAIPSEEKYALTLQKNYRWHLIVYCTPQRVDKPDIALMGWIRRVSMTSQLKNQLAMVNSREYITYIEHYIYYDAVTELATLQLTYPGEARFHRDWNHLLELLGRKELIGEPFADVLLFSPGEQTTTNSLSK